MLRIKVRDLTEKREEKSFFLLLFREISSKFLQYSDSTFCLIFLMSVAFERQQPPMNFAPKPIHSLT